MKTFSQDEGWPILKNDLIVTFLPSILRWRLNVWLFFSRSSSHVFLLNKHKQYVSLYYNKQNPICLVHASRRKMGDELLSHSTPQAVVSLSWPGTSRWSNCSSAALWGMFCIPPSTKTFFFFSLAHIWKHLKRRCFLRDTDVRSSCNVHLWDVYIRHNLWWVLGCVL